MNPLWKVFSNFYSKPATLPTPTTNPSLVWSGADTRSNHRPGWIRRILRRVGKSQTPLQWIQSQLFPVPLQASGFERAVKAMSVTSCTLRHWEGSPQKPHIRSRYMHARLTVGALQTRFSARAVNFLWALEEEDQNIWARWHDATSKCSVIVFQHNGIRWLNIWGESYWYSKHHQQMVY